MVGPHPIVVEESGGLLRTATGRRGQTAVLQQVLALIVLLLEVDIVLEVDLCKHRAGDVLACLGLEHDEILALLDQRGKVLEAVVLEHLPFSNRALPKGLATTNFYQNGDEHDHAT